MRIAGVEDISLVNGEGVRSVIFTTGCPHKCPGCHNSEMQDYWYGVDWDIEDIVTRIKENSDLIDGVTLSGGDPLFQLNNTFYLLKRLKEEGIENIWLYTGYYFEDVPSFIKRYVEVIIDGPYDQTRYAARWRGSDNQRVFRKLTGNRFIESPHKPLGWK